MNCKICGRKCQSEYCRIYLEKYARRPEGKRSAVIKAKNVVSPVKV